MNCSTLHFRTCESRTPMREHVGLQARIRPSFVSSYRGSTDHVDELQTLRGRILDIMAQKAPRILDIVYNSQIGVEGYFCGPTVLSLRLSVFSRVKEPYGHLNIHLDAFMPTASKGRIPKPGFYREGCFRKDTIVKALRYHQRPILGENCRDVKDQIRELLFQEDTDFETNVRGWAHFMGSNIDHFSGYLFTRTL